VPKIKKNFISFTHTHTYVYDLDYVHIKQIINIVINIIADKHHSAEHYEQVVKQSRAGITQALHF
jgi:hypothetical protein